MEVLHMRKTQKETVTLRLDPAYRMMLKENAEERGMTVTQVLTQMLDSYFDAWRKYQGAPLSDKEINRVLGKVDNRMLESLIQEGEIK
jgi:uncharacterized protein (DUF1778 family)